MFVAPLKNNIKSALIILLLTSFTLWGFTFLITKQPISESVEANHILFHLFFTNHLSVIGAQFISLFSILLGAFFVNYIAIEQEITSKTNYIPAFLYILFAFSSAKNQDIEPILIANLFLLPSIYFLISSYRQDLALSSCFLAGLFLGLASFFYIYFLILFPIVFIALLILKSFNWREWVLLLIGSGTPLYFYITFGYLNNNEVGAFDLLRNSFSNTETPIISEYYLLFFVFIIFILVLAIFHYFSKGFGNKIKTIKIKYVLLWLLLLSLFVIFYKQNTDMIFLPNIIPLSIIIGDYLSEIKKIKIANTLLFLLMGGLSIIYCHVLGMF